MTRDIAIARAIFHLDREETVSVLAARQTGKTTFLLHLQRRLQARGDSCVYVDFDGSHYDDSAQMMPRLLERVQACCPGIVLPQEICTSFFELLSTLKCAGALTFLIDELLSARNVATAVLQGVRAYQVMSISGGLERPHRFVFAGSTDLVEFALKENPYVSPYNVAEALYLEDFDQQQVRSFVERLGQHRFSEQSIGRIFELTRGHPYLVQFLCSQLFEHPQEAARRLGDVRSVLDASGIEKTDNVRNMLNHILFGPQAASPDMPQILRAILEGELIPFTPTHIGLRHLYLNGCVRDKGGYCAIRNPIYEAILRKTLGLHKSVERISDTGLAKPRPASYEDYMRKLKNFAGWIVVTLLDGTEPMPYDATSGAFTLRSKSDYVLKIRVARQEQRPQEDGLCERLLIEGGEDPTDPVKIVVSLESFYDLGLGDDQSREFPPDQPETTATYKFEIATQEKTDEPVQLFISIYQDVSLVLIIRLHLQISEA